jgi:hypothetical protein
MGRNRRKTNYIKPKRNNPALEEFIQSRKQPVMSDIPTGSFLNLPVIDEATPIEDPYSNVETKGNLSDAIARATKNGNEVHTNYRQSYIIITEDKAKLHLIDYEKKINNHLKAKYTIFTSSSMMLTLFTTYISTDFKQFIISAESWKVIYIIAFGVVAIFCFVSVFRIFWNKNPSIECILQRLENENNNRNY